MLKRSLQELTIATLFSCKPISIHIRDFLANPKLSNAETLGELCSKALGPDLESRYPCQFRAIEFDRLFAVLWKRDIFSSPQIDFLGDMFDRLMIRNGDFIQYRDQRVQEYCRLAADIDPTLFASWHLAEHLQMNEVISHNATRIMTCQHVFFAPQPRSGKAFAESHVHWGGIQFDGLLMAGGILAIGKQDDTRLAEAPFSGVRRLLRVLLDWSEDNSFNLDHRLADAVADVPIDHDVDLRDWQTVKDASVLSGTVDVHWLRMELAGAVLAGRLSEAWLWLTTFLWFLYRQADTPISVRACVIHIFIELMLVRRTIIMGGVGLKQFQHSSKQAQALTRHVNKLTANAVAVLRDRMRHIQTSEDDRAEIKVTADSLKPALIGKFACTSRHWDNIGDPSALRVAMSTGPLPLSKAEIDYVRQLETWHLCAAFSRGMRDQSRKANREDIWKVAKNLLVKMDKESGWTGEPFLGKRDDGNIRFQAARWIRGLDVFGDENELKIELFAPALRWLRRGFAERPREEMPSNSFHLSVHAGEEYGHPLSGMRHVDETVRFCEMRSGDRLGHALALGVDPARWCERHGDAVIAVDEHLDNLVWMWHYACELSGPVPVASRIVARLERRIARFASHIPWLNPQLTPLLARVPAWPRSGAHTPAHDDAEHAGKKTPTPELLYQAWKLRRNCHGKLMDALQNPLIDDRHAIPDVDRLKHADAHRLSDSAEMIYLDREVWLSDQKTHLKQSVLLGVDASCTVPRERERGVSGEQNEKLLYDYDTPEELEFMNALQDYLTDAYDAKGIIIETNPTSNVYIARLDNYTEHPIFRWNPPELDCLQAGATHNRWGLRRGPISVLINTDDPGVMPTTLRTEFELVAEASVDLGFSRTSTDRWLNRIREFGMDQFRANHLPVFTNDTGAPL